MSVTFAEVGAGVFVLRYPVLDVNSTLVVGDGAALVVDTLSTAPQAVLLRDAVRRLTAAPLTVVNTHHHFDHCFGNATLDPVAVHAHPEAAARLRVTDPESVYARWHAADPELSAVREVRLRVPDRLVPAESTVDVGGRRVTLRHPGRGHTAGDLVVWVPDAGVLVAGDLVEEGGPPQFEDGYPLEWPAALADLLDLGADVVVPGHGAVCDREFVRGQHAELAALEWLIRDGHADGAPAAAVAARATYDRRTAITAVTRGYAELAGTA